MAGLKLGTGFTGSAVGNLYGGYNGASVPPASTVPEGPPTITQQGFGVPPATGAGMEHGLKAAAIGTGALILLAFIWWTLPRLPMTSRLRAGASFRDRLLNRLIINPETGCVEWAGYKLKGYGRIKRGDEVVYTHRAMYELFEGPVPEGMELDHLCRNPSCANVAHLEAVPHQVNMQRGTWGLKTECPKGHPLDGRNNRERYCLTCNRERAARNRERSS